LNIDWPNTPCLNYQQRRSDETLVLCISLVLRALIIYRVRLALIGLLTQYVRAMLRFCRRCIYMEANHVSYTE
jgi:hypothetical protein